MRLGFVIYLGLRMQLYANIPSVQVSPNLPSSLFERSALKLLHYPERGHFTGLFWHCHHLALNLEHITVRKFQTLIYIKSNQHFKKASSNPITCTKRRPYSIYLPIQGFLFPNCQMFTLYCSSCRLRNEPLQKKVHSQTLRLLKRKSKLTFLN